MSALAGHLIPAAALALLFYLSGRLAATLAGARIRCALERTPGGTWALGTVVWSLIVFVLGAAGLLLRPLLIGTSAVVAAAGAACWWRWRRHAEAVAERPDPVPWGRVPAFALAAVAALIFLALYLQAIRPFVFADEDVYHLSLPRLYLEAGGFYRVPFNVYSNWPLGIEMLFLLAMSWQDFLLAKPIQLMFLAVTLWAAAGLSGQGLEARSHEPARDGRYWAGAMGAALLLLDPVTLFEARLAYVDIATALYFALGFAFLHRALERRRDERAYRHELVLAGLFAGAMAASKLPAAAGWLALVIVWLAATRLRGGVRRATTDLVLLSAPLVALLTPWLLKAWLSTGNPVYPFAYSILGGPEWSPRLGAQLLEWQRAIGMGRGFGDNLLLPLRVVLFGGRGYDRFDGQLSPTWLLALPIALWGVGRDRLTRRLLAAAGLYFLFWALGSQQMRFLIPALPLFAAAAARSMTRLLGRRDEAARTAAAWLVAAVLGGLMLHAALTYLRQAPHLLPLLSLPREETLRRAEPEIARLVAEHVPESGHLLLLGTNGVFFMPRPAIADSFFEASQIRELFAGATLGEARARLAELDVSHIVVDRRGLGIVEYPPPLTQLLASPSVSLSARGENGRFELLRLAER